MIYLSSRKKKKFIAYKVFEKIVFKIGGSSKFLLLSIENFKWIFFLTDTSVLLLLMSW